MNLSHRNPLVVYIAGAAFIAALVVYLESQHASPKPERFAPAPSASALPEAGPGDAGIDSATIRPLTCDETLAEIDRRLALNNGDLSDKDHDELIYLPRQPLADADAGSDPACALKIASRLIQVETCGRAANALAVGFFGAAKTPGTLVTRVLHESHAGCAPIYSEAAGFASDPTIELAKELEGRAKRSGEDRPSFEAAWLSFGSLGEIAGRLERGEVVRFIEQNVRTQLQSANDANRVLMLRAAGNAGCVSCAPFFAKALSDSSPEIRRAGATGFRFVPTKAAVSAMCARLEADDDLTVRDIAAWALQWRKNEDEARATCLVRAAMNDKVKSVRIQATQSLGLLAHDSNLGRAALIHLTGPEAPPEVARLATQHVMSEGERALQLDERELGKYFEKNAAEGK